MKFNSNLQPIYRYNYAGCQILTCCHIWPTSSFFTGSFDWCFVCLDKLSFMLLALWMAVHRSIGLKWLAASSCIPILVSLGGDPPRLGPSPALLPAEGGSGGAAARVRGGAARETEKGSVASLVLCFLDRPLQRQLVDAASKRQPGRNQTYSMPHNVAATNRVCGMCLNRSCDCDERTASRSYL